MDIVDIQQACNLMFEVYQNPQLSRVGQKEAYAREDDAGGFAKTRGYGTPRIDTGMEMSPAVGSVTSQGTKRGREGSGEGEEEWGAEGKREEDRPGPSSPKRQRRDSEDNAQSRVPPQLSRIPNGSRVPPGATNTVDDVQARIDDIVNRSQSASVNPEKTEQPPALPPDQPSLPRRPSQQQQSQQWSGPPPRRRSDEGEQRERPPSQQSNHEPAQIPVPAPAAAVLRPESANGRRESEVGEDKVDYGSEEGEL